MLRPEATTRPIHAMLGLSVAELDDALAWARRAEELLESLDDAELQALLGCEAAPPSASPGAPQEPRSDRAGASPRFDGPTVPVPASSSVTGVEPPRAFAADAALPDHTRRRAPRYSLSTPVVLRVDQMPGLQELSTHDISRHGVFIESNAPPECHARISVLLPFPDGSRVIHLVGEVVRVVTTRQAAASGCAPGFGVSFSPVSEQSRRDLECLLEHAKSGAAADVPRPRGSALTQAKTLRHVRLPAAKLSTG